LPKEVYNLTIKYRENSISLVIESSKTIVDVKEFIQNELNIPKE